MPIEHRDVGEQVLDHRDRPRSPQAARPLIFRCRVDGGRLVATEVVGPVEEATGYPASWFIHEEVTLCDLIHDEATTEHLGREGSEVVTLWTRDGRARAFLMERMVIQTDEQDEPTEFIASLVDITERSETEAVLTLHQRVLELIAAGTDLTVILNQICICVESFFPGITAVIMRVGENDLLHVASAPSLPDQAVVLIDGFPIGPRSGNCGTAVYERRQVITPNTLDDPAWEGNRHFARRFGIISKWSTPIFSPEGEVFGTLGLSRPQVGRPSPVQQRIMEAATYLAGVAMDRERHERQRKHFERQLRAIFEASPDVIFMKDADRRYVAINPAIERISALRADEIQGRTDEEVFGPSTEARIKDDDLAVLRGETVMKEETRHLSDGFEHILNIIKVPVRDEHGAIVGICGYARDVTSQRQAEQEQHAFELKMQQTQKLESIGVLAGGVAHDFNNLLVGILGNASLARQRIESDAPAQESLSRIEDAAMHASALTNQLLAYSGKGRFLIEAVDLSSIVLDMTRLIEVSISKRARLAFELDESLPVFEGDPSQVRQVVMNLLTNASDALDGEVGEIRFRTYRMTLGADRLQAMLHDADARPGEYVMLEVSDSGVGMDENTRARIFDPFFTTKFTGRGLGLAATMGVVRAHHGAIEVRSERGVGTTFRVAFPVTPSVAVAERAEKRSEEREVAPGRILVVDDEKVVREMIEATLELEGFDPVACPDGRTAIETFQAAPEAWQAVLLDVTLPTMTGGEVLQRLREIDPDVRVILMSGFVESDVLSNLDLGEVEFIQKPFVPASMIERLRSVARA